MKLVNIKCLVFMLFSQLMFSQEAVNNKIDNTESSLNTLLESKDIEKRDAFRAKSEAKVEDLYNYLNIIGNIGFEDDMRLHTTSLVKNLFTEQATVDNILSTSKSTISINKFLDILLASKEKVQFFITDISLESNILNYSLTLKKGTNKDTMNMTQTIYWNYKTKQFGSHSKKVLTSSLGSINDL